MAAVFPLDTTQPWTFNGVTYEYDASEDRWFVISTNKVDAVDIVGDGVSGETQTKTDPIPSIGEEIQ